MSLNILYTVLTIICHISGVSFLAEGSWRQADDLGAKLAHYLASLGSWIVSCGAMDHLSNTQILLEAERLVAGLET